MDCKCGSRMVEIDSTVTMSTIHHCPLCGTLAYVQYNGVIQWHDDHLKFHLIDDKCAEISMVRDPLYPSVRVTIRKETGDAYLYDAEVYMEYDPDTRSIRAVVYKQDEDEPDTIVTLYEKVDVGKFNG